MHTNPATPPRYRVSKVTQKRLPSKNVLRKKIAKLQAELNDLEAQLLEHFETFEVQGKPLPASLLKQGVRGFMVDLRDPEVRDFLLQMATAAIEAEPAQPILSRSS